MDTQELPDQEKDMQNGKKGHVPLLHRTGSSKSWAMPEHQEAISTPATVSPAPIGFRPGSWDELGGPRTEHMSTCWCSHVQRLRLLLDLVGTYQTTQGLYSKSKPEQSQKRQPSVPIFEGQIICISEYLPQTASAGNLNQQTAKT